MNYMFCNFYNFFIRLQYFWNYYFLLVLVKLNENEKCCQQVTKVTHHFQMYNKISEKYDFFKLVMQVTLFSHLFSYSSPVPM